MFCVCVVFVWFLVLGVFFVLCLCFPHGSEINTVVCEVVCEVERPSELSWRARHGRKKNHRAIKVERRENRWQKVGKERE